MVRLPGELPRRHADELQLAAIPEIDDWGRTLAEYRVRAAAHLARVQRATGDWRPAVDGLRSCVQALWQRLDEQDREEFLRTDASAWGRMRHRMPPTSADLLTALERADRLTRAAAEVIAAEPLTGGGLRVTLSDGTSRDVGWVVNCTGTSSAIIRGGDPLADDLLTVRGGVALACLSTGDLGLRTRDGRVLDSAGTTDAPIWTLGSVRRGELWESTAIPEIRTQAASSRSRSSTRWLPCHAGSRTDDWSVATTRWPGRATPSACRSPPRPMPPPRTTPASSG
jgi:uncharacterized NAD(P)/FAD-binding protein YdhS